MKNMVKKGEPLWGSPFFIDKEIGYNFVIVNRMMEHTLVSQIHSLLCGDNMVSHQSV